jgi:hypothetical protein
MNAGETGRTCSIVGETYISRNSVVNLQEAVDTDGRNTPERNEGVRPRKDWNLQQIRMSTE